MTVIISALLAFVTQQVPTVDTGSSADIQVIGRKLKDWRASITSRKGVQRCRIRKSTGDADIDAIGCSAMQACLPRFEPRLIATAADKSLDAAARREANATTSHEMTACITGEHDRLIEALAERRFRERGGALRP